MKNNSFVERVGTCLCFLLLAMITSAMFYEGAPDVDRKQPEPDLLIGPLRFSLQQLYYSLISAVISTIPITFVVFIFRKARTRSDADGSWCCSKPSFSQQKSAVRQIQVMPKDEESDICVFKDKQNDCGENGTSADSPLALQSESKSCCAHMPWMTRLERQLDELQKLLLIRTGSAEMEKTWPRCWRVVAWILIAMGTLGCSFFVLLYSMQWGKDVSEEWLSSFFLSFIQSLVIVDPFKVFLMAGVLAILFRKSGFKDQRQLDVAVIKDVNQQFGIKEKTSPPRQSLQTSFTSHEDIETLALMRKTQMLVNNTLVELLFHAMYLVIVCSLCFTNRTSDDFRMYEMIDATLVSQEDLGFKHITSQTEYFNWLDNVATPFLFPATDYEGNFLVSEDRMYTEVWDLYRLGAPRMRQLRMPKGSCPSREVPTHDCVLLYTMGDEETIEKCLGWTDTPCSRVDQLRVTATAWYFRSAIDVWGSPISGEYNTYGGGGYISNLDINLIVAESTLKEMKNYLWADRQTRAVFLEFTLYNPNVNLFTCVTLLAEFLDTGGVVPFVSIYPFRAHGPTGALGSYIKVCEIAGIIMAVLSLIYVSLRFYQERRAALRDFWFMLDAATTVLALLAVSMFMSRLAYTHEAIAEMKDDYTQFVNFQNVVIWDFAYIVCLGLLLAIGFLRLIKLAGYTEWTRSVYDTLALSSDVLPGFLGILLFMLVGFAGLGVLLFQSSSPHYKSYLNALKTLFTATLGNNEFRETNVPVSSEWLSHIYFITLAILLVLIFNNLALAMLADLVALTPDQGSMEGQEDGLVFMLLWDSLRRRLGAKVDPVERLRGFVKTKSSQPESSSFQ